MIPVTTLITKLNDLITAGGLTDLELAQAFGAIVSIENRGVNSVATTSNLPPAANNKGRFFYITSENRYVLSNGTSWSANNILRSVDFNAYGWGNNSSGQVGDNTTVSKSSPIQTIGLTDWIQISAGDIHSLGISANGVAWAWGNNFRGKLGDNTITNRSSPVSVVGNLFWTQVSAGGNHSLGIRTDGSAWAWGYNSVGQLGIGNIVSRNSPTSIVGYFTDWTQVSAGITHSLGLRANGTAWAWGNGAEGRLGVYGTTNRSSPVQVLGSFTDWLQVSAGNRHSLGLRANGTAWAWGYNGSGRLGVNDSISRSSPTLVVGGFTDWIQVSAGSEHSLGLRSNGTAWAWGAGSTGRLGDNTIVTRSSPVSVVGGFTDWIQLSAGSSHSLGLRANGTAWAWGSNSVGQLGDETITSKSSPVSVVGGINSWVLLSTVGSHNIGMKA